MSFVRHAKNTPKPIVDENGELKIKQSNFVFTSANLLGHLKKAEILRYTALTTESISCRGLRPPTSKVLLGACYPCGQNACSGAAFGQPTMEEGKCIFSKMN